MKLKVIKKKASSFKEIGHEIIEINDVTSFYELLVEISRYEFMHQQNMQEHTLLEEDIRNLSQTGKITFGNKYNQKDGEFDQAIQTMVQDYQDGLIRVFFNGEECLSLEEKLRIQENNEIVLIRLVMLAGRLW